MSTEIDLDLKREVDRLFDEAPDRFETLRDNPVTDGRWVTGLDPIVPQKRAAARALRAAKWFAREHPDLPPLPLNYSDREDMKRGGMPHILAWYARSLQACDYDYDTHPSFYDYACGVMALPDAPYFIKEDVQLMEQYSPRPLPGLDSGLYWKPAGQEMRPKRRR